MQVGFAYYCFDMFFVFSTGFLITFYSISFIGVSLAIKTMHSRVEVIGVEPENVASYAAAIKAGHPVNGFKEATLADGLAVPIVG